MHEETTCKKFWEFLVMIESNQQFLCTKKLYVKGFEKFNGIQTVISCIYSINRTRLKK